MLIRQLVAMGGPEDFVVQREIHQVETGDGDDGEFDSGDEAEMAQPRGDGGEDRPRAEEDGEDGDDVLDDKIFIEGASGSDGGIAVEIGGDGEEDGGEEQPSDGGKKRTGGEISCSWLRLRRRALAEDEAAQEAR